MSSRTPIRPIPLAILCLCLMPAAPAATQTGGPAWRWTPELVVDIARVSSVEIAPDGSQVLYALSRPRAASDKPGAAWSNLWVVPFSGGPARRMTSADADDRAPAWSPDGARIAFLSDRGGEKAKTRLWLMPVTGGEAAAVSDEKSEVSSFAWSPDGRRIAWIAADPKPESKEKEEAAGRDWIVADADPRPRRLWTADVAGQTTAGARRVSSPGDRSVWEFDWSPSSDAVVGTVSETPRADDSYIGKRIMILPLAGGEARELVGLVGKVDQVAWSRDGRTIAYRAGVSASDPYSGSLFVVPAAGGRPVNLTGDRPESVNRIDWLPDGRIACVTVRGTRTSHTVVDPSRPATVRALLEPHPLVYQTVSWSADGRRVAMAAGTADAPPEVYAGRVEDRAPLRRLTHSNPALERLPRGKQEVVTYRAGDGLEIEAVVVHPVSSPRGRTAPLIVVAHGGPESQYMDGWNTTYAAPAHAFAERGYFLMYPNYRGSTGRGVTFAGADHKDLGGREFADVLDGIDALAARYPIDRRRVGITGGSYGGYFTALGVTRHSDRFAAGVELFGITNWLSFLGTSDIPIENSNVHWDLWCYEHEQTCRQASPIAHIGKASTPTLILQGDKDERVPRTQSDELYAALKWKGVPVEYVVYPREKHGFRERAHQLDACERILGWFERHLKP